MFSYLLIENNILNVCMYVHFRLNQTKAYNKNTAATAVNCIAFKYTEPRVSDNAHISARHFAYSHICIYLFLQHNKKSLLPHSFEKTKIQLLFTSSLCKRHRGRKVDRLTSDKFNTKATAITKPMHEVKCD